MSSAMVSAAAAQSRLFFFDDGAGPDVRSLGDSREQVGAQESPIARVLQSTIKNKKSKNFAASITPASQLSVRPAPEMLPSGIAAINALTGGWPRGCLTEICGPASSGRTTLLLAALAAATRRGEFCVLVDASDALDPRSAAEAGVELDRLLWVRCGEDASRSQEVTKNRNRNENWNENRNKNEYGDENRNKNQRPSQPAPPNPDRRLEQVLHVTDLLLESGGFGLVVLDLSDLPPQQARRIPLTTWFRFRRAVEHTPTVLLAIEQQPIAGGCSSLQIKLGSETDQNLLVTDQRLHPAHARLLTCLEITAELMRSRLERKPARSTAAFASKTAWAG
jgi:hypothetical protein